jgi:hypothetical protein
MVRTTCPKISAMPGETAYKCDAKSISKAQGNVWGWGGNIGFVLEW